MQDASTSALIESHMWIVERFKAKYQPSAPQADLHAAGALGLVEAAARFEPARGNRFSTYAWTWVKYLVLSEVRKDHVVPVTRWGAEAARKRGGQPNCQAVPLAADDSRCDSNCHTGTVNGPEHEQETAADRSMRLRVLKHEINCLEDPRHRYVMARTMVGMSIEDIAKRMGVNARLVKQLMDEAQEILREAVR